VVGDKRERRVKAHSAALKNRSEAEVCHDEKAKRCRSFAESRPGI